MDEQTKLKKQLAKQVLDVTLRELYDRRLGQIGVIFDVDGVLADTNQLHYQSWSDACEHHGIQGYTRAFYDEHNCGTKRDVGSKKIISTLASQENKSLDAKILAETKNSYYNELIEAGKLKPFNDAVRFLLEARDFGAQITYGSSSTNAEKILKSIIPAQTGAFSPTEITDFGINSEVSLYDLFTTPGIDGNKKLPSKPDPSVFIEAQKKIQTDARVTIVLEDAQNGVDAAKAANFYCIGINRNGCNAKNGLRGADLICKSLEPGSFYDTITELIRNIYTTHARAITPPFEKTELMT